MLHFKFYYKKNISNFFFLFVKEKMNLPKVYSSQSDPNLSVAYNTDPINIAGKLFLPVVTNQYLVEKKTLELMENNCSLHWMKNVEDVEKEINRLFLDSYHLKTNSMVVQHIKSCYFDKNINTLDPEKYKKHLSYQKSSLAGINATFFLKYKDDQTDKILFICKYSPNQKLEVQQEYTHETFVGLQLINVARQFLPNFPFTYGKQNCSLFNNEYCPINDKSITAEIPVLFTEYIGNSVTLASFYKNQYIEFAKYAQQLFLQLFNALNLLKSLSGVYQHGDLHWKNILIKKLNHYTYIPIYEFENDLPKKVTYLLTRYVLYIIDFERSSIFDYESLMRISKEEVTEYRGMEVKDIKRLFISTYIQLTNKIIKDNIDIERVLSIYVNNYSKKNKSDLIPIFTQKMGEVLELVIHQKDYTFKNMLDFISSNTFDERMEVPLLFNNFNIDIDPVLSTVSNSVCLNHRCNVNIQEFYKKRELLESSSFYPIELFKMKKYFEERQQNINNAIMKLKSAIYPTTIVPILDITYYRAFLNYVMNNNEVLVTLFLKKDRFPNTKYFCIDYQYRSLVEIMRIYYDINQVMDLSGIKKFTVTIHKMLDKVIFPVNHETMKKKIYLNEGDMIQIDILDN